MTRPIDDHRRRWCGSNEPTSGVRVTRSLTGSTLTAGPEANAIALRRLPNHYEVTVDGQRMWFPVGRSLAIEAGAGADAIAVAPGDYPDVTLRAGKGDDTVASRGGGLTIDLGSGADAIASVGSNNRIISRSGDCQAFISGSRNLFEVLASPALENEDSEERGEDDMTRINNDGNCFPGGVNIRISGGENNRVDLSRLGPRTAPNTITVEDNQNGSVRGSQGTDLIQVGRSSGIDVTPGAGRDAVVVQGGRGNRVNLGDDLDPDTLDAFGASNSTFVARGPDSLASTGGTSNSFALGRGGSAFAQDERGLRARLGDGASFFGEQLSNASLRLSGNNTFVGIVGADGVQVGIDGHTGGHDLDLRDVSNADIFALDP